MSTERKEPTISPDAFDLTDRVRLTWREVRDLAEPDDQQPTVQPLSETQETSTGTRKLTEEEMKAIAGMVADAVEERVKEALQETLEISLRNASNRLRADLDRSVTGIVSQSIRQELAKINIEQQ